ncbi:MAG TPA: tetratricopeptide repeat protein [Burkholderiales bacterium]|jgi:tetratricopeptide (TPR) repeat protein/SAM-dependent methyltransferase
MAVLNAHLQDASRLAQAGRFADAARLYHEFLETNPDHAEALHFLGICLVRSGEPDKGMPLIERSVGLAPRNSLYRQNFGLMLAEAGKLSGAEAQFDEILQSENDNATAHNYLGMVRQRLGRMDEAIASYEAALRLRPADAAAANNLGYCLFERGELERALPWLRRSIAADATSPMAHSNLGNALREMGDLRTAAECYRRALALAPRFANAHHNLALTLRDLGEPAAALDAARAAVRCDPGHRAAWQLFAEVMGGMRFAQWNAELAADCEQLLSQAEVDVQPCAEAILSLARTRPRGNLFLLLLEHALVADESFERDMTALRRETLAAPSLELCCALAQQCFLNQYVWGETEAEAARAAALERSAKTPLELAAAAMYRPPAGHAKPCGGGAAFERMWRRLVEEPAIERSLTVASLTPVREDVSRRVRAQYETNPYPRWQRAPVPGAFPLPRMLRSLFPHADPAKLAAPDAPDILIAGCGTGRHAAVTAQLQPHGRVLAIDISRASLAYAMRRCAELGLGNLRFAHADLLELGALEERFDLVECSGVLHHLREPLEGWRVLLSLVRSGGFMKLGLYSETARRHIVAARDVVKGLSVAEARRRLFELPARHPARAVTELRDFYSAAGARDLVLHVQEHRFTIPQLASALAELGVEFLGFELPGPRLALSLEQWDAYESANPDSFASMYQFWIRKP